MNAVVQSSTLAVVAAAVVALAGCGGEADVAQRATTPQCEETTGETIELDLDISMAGFNDRHALVHLPPCYGENNGAGDPAADVRYPAIYLLHGGGQQPESWFEAPITAAATVDRMIVDGDIAPVILVMPPRSTKPTGFSDILDELIASVDATYRTVDDPGGRGIGGFSASGRATAQSAFTGTPRAAAIGLFAVTWPAALPDEILAGMSERSDRPAVYVNVGDRDPLQNRIPDIEQALAAVSIDVTVEIVEGGHNVEFVADRLPDWLRWFDAELALG